MSEKYLSYVLFDVLLVLRRHRGSKAWRRCAASAVHPRVCTLCHLQVLWTLSLFCKTNRSYEKYIPVLILSFATVQLSRFSPRDHNRQQAEKDNATPRIFLPYFRGTLHTIKDNIAGITPKECLSICYINIATQRQGFLRYCRRSHSCIDKISQFRKFKSKRMKVLTSAAKNTISIEGSTINCLFFFTFSCHCTDNKLSS